MKSFRIIKIAFSFSLLFTLFISSFYGSPTVEAAALKTAFVTTSTNTPLNVRSGAGTNYKSIGALKSGSSVNVYSKTSTGWSEIRYKSKKSYVSTKYLTFYTGVKVTKHHYKAIKDLAYAQVSGMKNKKVEDKINQTLFNDAKASYNTYLKIKADAKEDKKSGACQKLMCDYEYFTAYKVNYNDGSKLSILSKNYAYTGGAHGIGYAESFNFNINNGKQIKISNVLTSKSKMNSVQKYAYTYMKNREPFKYFVTKSSDVKINKDSQFYYNRNGITLVFQEYEVASYADGNPTVTVPYSVYK